MKETIRRLILVHVVILTLSTVGFTLVVGLHGGLSSLAGVLAFSVPVLVTSFLVLRASTGDKARFWRRFMAAELVKWASSAVLLALALSSEVFVPFALMAGFFLSVLVQVFFPIFVPKVSES